MFITIIMSDLQPLWAIKAQFSIRPNWASCSYSLFSVYFYLTSAGCDVPHTLFLFLRTCFEYLLHAQSDLKSKKLRRVFKIGIEYLLYPFHPVDEGITVEKQLFGGNADVGVALKIYLESLDKIRAVLLIVIAQ